MSTSFDTGLPASSKLSLQCCGNCGGVNYPPRELCGHCLADELAWQQVNERGVLQASVDLHYSLEPQYQQQLPLRVGSVKLECGPIALAHLQQGICEGDTVCLRVVQDSSDNRLLVATTVDWEDSETMSNWLEQLKLRELQV